MDTKKLRQKILDLAIHGKLVPQDPNDEPASVLLECIRTEKERLVKEGKIKKSKASKTSDTPHYENVPFEVPSSWEWTTIASFSYDLLYGTSEKSSNEGLVPVLRMGNITRTGSIDYSDLVYSSNEEDIKKYKLEKDDLLFNRTNSSEWVGKTAIFKIKEPTIYAGYLIRVRCILVDSDYINFVMNSSYHREWCNQVKTDAVNQSNINAQKLSNFSIPIPPLYEQHRIVAEIEKWFALIEQIEQEKTDLLTAIKQTKSKILDLAIHGKLVPQDPNDEPASELLKRINPNAEITCDNGQYGKVPEEWIMCTIGDLFDVVSAKRVLKSDWKNKGIPFYRAREIVQLHKEGIADKDLFITEELFAELKDKFGTPNVGDIMLSAVGSIGYTYIVNEKDSFYYKDASVLCLRNVNKLNSQYFSMLFETTFVKEQMHDNSKGTTVDTITIEKLKKYFVPLPPLAEQHRIVTKIEELFSSLDNIQKALEV